MTMFSLVLLISFFYLGSAIDCGGNKIASTIIVDQQGKGAFITVQGAIDSIKSSNANWVMIKINPGVYKEKVQIPKEKPCIILKGSGINITTITYDDSFQSNGTFMSATLISSPPNVVLSGITFKNTYDLENGPAVATNLAGDKSAIFDCSFIGYQDTLLAAVGRSYFKNCFIQGEIDFIFGSGQSYFENCVINATPGNRRKIPGYVTAHRRDSAEDSNGFVFRGGSVVGTGQVHLGRPWSLYARVIFWETYFSSIVTPEGWNIWNLKGGQEFNTTFVEVNCTGPGADKKNRVIWEKQPSSLNLNDFTLSSFINYDGWLAQIPSII